MRILTATPLKRERWNLRKKNHLFKKKADNLTLSFKDISVNFKIKIECKIVLYAVLCLVAQSCPTLCDPMDCSPPGSSGHGILQARVLDWVVIPFSRRSSWPRDQTQVSITGRFFTIWVTRKAHLCYKQYIYIYIYIYFFFFFGRSQAFMTFPVPHLVSGRMWVSPVRSQHVLGEYSLLSRTCQRVSSRDCCPDEAVHKYFLFHLSVLALTSRPPLEAIIRCPTKSSPR